MVLEILSALQRPSDAFEPTPLGARLLHTPIKLLLQRTHTLLTHLRSPPSPRSPPLRIVCISDTHAHTLSAASIPRGDILIHAGDLTNTGSIPELQAQIDWLASLPHREIVVVAGNHDTFLDPRTRPSLPAADRDGALDWRRLHYLQHKQLTLRIVPESARAGSSDGTPLLSTGESERRVKLYGAPQIPACGPADVHAFQYKRGSDAWSETVPEDTDVLVSHTPPAWHLDLGGVGCGFLLGEVRRVRPVLHVFGHVHWGAGKEVVWWDGAHEAYVEGMGVQSQFSLKLWWSVVRVVYRGVRELLWDRVWGGQRPYTTMVNAAQMKGNTGRLGNAVQVVDI